jgi:hypothetical protein
MLQAPFAAEDSGPFYWPPWKSRNVVLLGKSLANQCLQRAPKKLLVALGPGAHDVDQQVSPGHGGDKAGVAGAGAGLNILLPLVVVALLFAKVLPMRLCLQNGLMLLIAPVCIDPGACGFTDQNPRLGLGLGGQERFGAWFDCCLKDQGGLGRKAESIDRGEQLPAFDVLLPQLLGFLPQLLGFVLDPLAVVPHLQDFVLELFHPPFVLHLALLVTGIPSPVERRQQ